MYTCTDIHKGLALIDSSWMEVKERRGAGYLNWVLQFVVQGGVGGAGGPTFYIFQRALKSTHEVNLIIRDWQPKAESFQAGKKQQKSRETQQIELTDGTFPIQEGCREGEEEQRGLARQSAQKSPSNLSWARLRGCKLFQRMSSRRRWNPGEIKGVALPISVFTVSTHHSSKISHINVEMIIIMEPN